MTNDEFCNPTLKTRLAAVSSLVFSFSSAFIYGSWRRWGPSQQSVGGEQPGQVTRTHTHTLAVSHTHSPPRFWSVAGNQNGSSTQEGQSAGTKPETLVPWRHPSFSFTTNTPAHTSVFCKHAAAPASHPGSRCPCCC